MQRRRSIPYTLEDQIAVEKAQLERKLPASGMVQRRTSCSKRSCNWKPPLHERVAHLSGASTTRVSLEVRPPLPPGFLSQKSNRARLRLIRNLPDEARPVSTSQFQLHPLPGTRSFKNGGNDLHVAQPHFARNTRWSILDDTASKIIHLQRLKRTGGRGL